MTIGVQLDVLQHDPLIATDVAKAQAAFGIPLPELERALVPGSDSDFYGSFGDPPLECFGRSALDHDSASSLEALSRLADKEAPAMAAHLEPLRRLDRPCLVMPYRSAFPLMGAHCHVVSAFDVAQALIAIAPAIGVTTQGDGVSGVEAAAINRMAGDDDAAELRVTWLFVFEVARLAMLHRKALLLA
jgi:hypothetical protein